MSGFQWGLNFIMPNLIMIVIFENLEWLMVIWKSLMSLKLDVLIFVDLLITIQDLITKYEKALEILKKRKICKICWRTKRIQKIIYKTKGSGFNEILSIKWGNFFPTIKQQNIKKQVYVFVDKM